jgi:hypothetical protein
MTPTCCLSAAM